MVGGAWEERIFLVETDKSKDIRETAIEAGVLSSRCSRQPIGPNSDSYEYLAFDDRDRSQGKALGALQVYRKHEVEEMVSSGKPKLLERVHSPIGLDINAVTVPELAVSIAAELIATRRADRRKVVQGPLAVTSESGDERG